LNHDERTKQGKDEDKVTYKPVRTEIINPKSISVDEFFGYYDNAQNPP